MRLHQVQVRVAPVLWWGVAGASTTSVSQVVSPMVRVSTMVVPAQGQTEELRGAGTSCKDGRKVLQLISPVSSHAFLLWTHVMSGWGESLPTTSLIIPVLSTATPFPAPVPLPGSLVPGNKNSQTKEKLTTVVN